LAQGGKKVVIRCIYSSAIYFPAIYLYFVVFRTHSLSFVPLNLPRSKNQCQHDSDQASDWDFIGNCLPGIGHDPKRVGGCRIRNCSTTDAGGRDTADNCGGVDAGSSENGVGAGDHDVTCECSREGGGNKDFHGREDCIALTCTNADLDTHAVSGRVSGRERACET